MKEEDPPDTQEREELEKQNAYKRVKLENQNSLLETHKDKLTLLKKEEEAIKKEELDKGDAETLVQDEDDEDDEDEALFMVKKNENGVKNEEKSEKEEMK